MMEYSKHVKKLGMDLFELLSEALGLNPNHFKRHGLWSRAICHGPLLPVLPRARFDVRLQQPHR